MDTLKGTRDFLPRQKIMRDTLVAHLKNLFERYGYNPLETPALELEETLTSKFTGGEEILKEIYRLSDQADRKIALRYDLTVPFARVIAMNPNFKKPFKRYQIDKVWRNGPLKPGRYREFCQCDADVVGIANQYAEAELLRMVQDFFEKIGIKIVIYVNNKKLLDEIMAACGFTDATSAILSLDKLKKIGSGGVARELAQKGFSEASIRKMLDICKPGCTLLDIKSKIGQTQGITELEELFEYFKQFDVTIAQFDVSLARGLAYYTGAIWEVYAVDSKITSSIGAGGRYDKMIGNLIEAKEPIPAVGASFGFDTICDVLEDLQVSQAKDSVVQVYIASLVPLQKSIPILNQLRAAGVNADMDFNKRPVSKSFDFADKLSIPYVIIIGDDELASGKLSLKNMKSGEQQKLSIEVIIELLLR